MAKAKKKSPNKYDEKRKIEETFEDVTGVSVDVPPKQQEEGDKGFNEGLGGAGEKELQKKDKSK